VLDDSSRDVRAKAGTGADHAREVASIQRAAGFPERVEAAGPLHDVAEDTP
jgi:hypothetical protein